MKTFFKKSLPFLTALAFLVVAMVSASAQQDGSSSAPAAGAPPAATAPAAGPDIENPPLSGLDEPSSEPAYGGRSYLVPGIQISEAVNGTNGGLVAKTAGTNEVARGLGSIDLQKIWKKYRLGIDYVAGGSVFQGHINQPHLGNSYQIHTMAMDQRFLWRTGQFVLRDSFSYLPEGSFGFGSFGGSGALGSALGGGGTTGGAGTGLGSGITGGVPGSTFGGGTIGSIGIQPRISNAAVADVTQSFGPRSTVVLAVGYNFTEFLKNALTSLPLINSQTSSGQIGYDYLLNRNDRISTLYAYQSFHFPSIGTGNVNAHLVHLLYSHRINGRLNLVLGGGPQFIVFHTSSQQTSVPDRISGSGRAQLSYQLRSRTNTQLSYMHYVTPGSGFFAGANTDVVRGSFSQLIGRHWNLSADIGYSHNHQLQTSTSGASTAKSYNYWYGGSSLRRQIGRYFGAFVSYQYNDIRFNSTVCGTPGNCGLSTMTNVGVVGIDWHPHPFRLD